ncbi:MAG: methyltransferase domain-containing protein [Myxococcales bacterium]|nr:methyltransferase domain-containing protein [Myxococcales bacterium]MCB9755334.1 methyltransferase domain-containing protein [Myxococcales bacterium]
MPDPTTLTDLERHEVSLAEHQLTDFRAVNLFRMVGARVLPGSVIDVGCGGGGMVAWLLEQGHDARGIDMSPSTVRAAQRFLEGRGLDPSRIDCVQLEALIADGQHCDNVISMDVIEHIEDDQGAFAKLFELTRVGGRLIVTVPAMMSLWSERDVAMKHYRRYAPAELRALAERHALRVEDLRYWNMLGAPPTYLKQKLSRKALDESFRYGKPGLGARLLRGGLSAWFRVVENNVRPPLGLTLIMSATRLE